MSIKTLSRCGAVILLVTMVAGCSLTRPSAPGRNATSARSSSECSWFRSSCLYDGAYEPGEREYAEQEAQRLNQAEAQRIRRSSGN